MGIKTSLRVWKLSSASAAALLFAVAAQGLAGCSYLEDAGQHLGLSDPPTMPGNADFDYGPPYPPIKNPGMKRAIKEQQRLLQISGGRSSAPSFDKYIEQSSEGGSDQSLAEERRREIEGEGPSFWSNPFGSSNERASGERKQPMENHVAMAEIENSRMARVQTYHAAPTERVAAGNNYAWEAPASPAMSEPAVSAGFVEAPMMSAPVTASQLAETGEAQGGPLEEVPSEQAAENMNMPEGGYAAPVQMHPADMPPGIVPYAAQQPMQENAAYAAAPHMPEVVTPVPLSPGTQVAGAENYPSLHEVPAAPEYGNSSYRQEVLQSLEAENQAAEAARRQAMGEPAAAAEAAAPAPTAETWTEVTFPESVAPQAPAAAPAAPAYAELPLAQPAYAPPPVMPQTITYAEPAAAPVQTMPQQPAVVEVGTQDVNGLPTVSEISDANTWGDDEVVLQPPPAQAAVKQRPLLPDSRYQARRTGRASAATAMGPGSKSSKYE